MAVGDPSKLRSELLDSRFRAATMGRQAPDRRFPDGKMCADLADQMVRDELFLDGNARQNLATFCQTWDDEYVHNLMDQSINKNWIDKEEYLHQARDLLTAQEHRQRAPRTARAVPRSAMPVGVPQ